MKYLIILAFIIKIQISFGCTMFSVQVGNINFFGNNEDWSDNSPIIGFSTADANNFGFVWLGFSDGWAQGGMNEEGLCFDWFAGFSTSWTADPTKTNFNGDMCKEILKKCTTIEEVIEYYNKYNEPAFAHARPMYIDRYGNAIILKWIDGKVYAEFRSGNYQLMGARAAAIKPMLDGQTQFTLPYMAKMLDKAHQEGNYPTQYSNIFDTYNSKIYLFSLFDYSQCIVIDLKTELGKGNAIYNIKELFTSHELGPNILVDNLANVTYYIEVLTLEAIFPNPFQDGFTLELTSEDSMEIKVEISNILGQIYYVNNLGTSQGNNKIDFYNHQISNLPRGIYLLRVFSDNSLVTTLKIIKN